jgi:hypothetical protein
MKKIYNTILVSWLVTFTFAVYASVTQTNADSQLKSYPLTTLHCTKEAPFAYRVAYNYNKEYLTDTEVGSDRLSICTSKELNSSMDWRLLEEQVIIKNSKITIMGINRISWNDYPSY